MGETFPNARNAQTHDWCGVIDDNAAIADPDAAVLADEVRFTVLTRTLLRLEYAPDRCFEDRPSLFAVQRRLPAVSFERRREGDWLVLETDKLTLRYHVGSGRFGRENLSIRLRKVSPVVEWRPGTPNHGNLGGTARTLDECKGPIDLGSGVLSRDGWFLLDDSTRPVFSNGWVAARPDRGQQDWYFFGYGRDYRGALKDLTTVGGKIPLPPRFVFGSWYSRYWPYRAEDFLAIADEYRRRHFPLDVMVLDMDWHLEGWTGYTWNRKLIPDPPVLLAALRERGLKVTLNLHPADGVHPHEEAYQAFARAMGVDPGSRKPIPFDCTSPAYVKYYFGLLHNPLEAQGVDFWWIDWQQGTGTPIEGLDPLSWLNHLHFHDLQRSGAKHRPLILSRWGGWGSHRYPIQFSGDTHATWDVLKFLVPFTAAAGNVGAAYWSHDLGGHFAEGRTEPELFVRWVQFSAFAATMRVQSTLSAENDRRPWLDGPPFDEAARAAFELRYRLLPYVYTMARKCHDMSLPLNRPMYLAYPDDETAYNVPHQFMFGDDLIVAPVLQPGIGPRRTVDVEVWLPEGVWYELTTNARYIGLGNYTVSAALDHIPVFVRAGQPIPMAPPGRLHSAEALDVLHVRVYPGHGGKTHLYEDDGETDAYLSGRCAWTPLRYESTGPGHHDCRLRIGPTDGSYQGMPSKRSVVVECPATEPPKLVRVNGALLPGDAWHYDARTRTTTIHLARILPHQVCDVAVDFTGAP